MNFVYVVFGVCMKIVQPNEIFTVLSVRELIRLFSDYGFQLD